MVLFRGRGGNSAPGCRSRLARLVGVGVFEFFAQLLVQLPERPSARFERQGLDVGELRGDIDRCGFGIHTV